MKHEVCPYCYGKMVCDVVATSIEGDEYAVFCEEECDFSLDLLCLEDELWRSTKEEAEEVWDAYYAKNYSMLRIMCVLLLVLVGVGVALVINGIYKV